MNWTKEPQGKVAIANSSFHWVLRIWYQTRNWKANSESFPQNQADADLNFCLYYHVGDWNIFLYLFFCKPMTFLFVFWFGFVLIWTHTTFKVIAHLERNSHWIPLNFKQTWQRKHISWSTDWMTETSIHSLGREELTSAVGIGTEKDSSIHSHSLENGKQIFTSWAGFRVRRVKSKIH